MKEEGHRKDQGPRNDQDTRKDRGQVPRRNRVKNNSKKHADEEKYAITSTTYAQKLQKRHVMQNILEMYYSLYQIQAFFSV